MISERLKGYFDFSKLRKTRPRLVCLRVLGHLCIVVDLCIV